MNKTTRFKFNKVLSQISALNGVESTAAKFAVEPSIAQKMIAGVQESSEFLKKINMEPVTEGEGEAIGLTQGSTIAGRSNTKGGTTIMKYFKYENDVYAFELDGSQDHLISDQHKGFTVKFHERARAEGWASTAAQPPANGGKKTDWNDLFQWDKLNKDVLPKYKHYGELLIAETAEEAGLLIYNHYESRRHSFYYNHKFRLYWWELDYDKYNKAVQHLEDRNNEAAENGGKILTDKEIRESALKNCSAAKEICNAQVEPLYFQRNEITDESWYYFKLQSPWSETKTTFTADQMSSRSKFKPRVMSVMSGAMWTGTDQQLETFIKRTTERLREVKTIDYIGYSREYETYIFEKHAVHKGQVIPINEHDFFKIKRKEIKTLASSPAITINPKKEFNPTWWNDFYRVRGAKGIIALAWWMGSYFAEQIRAEHSSYPFMEIVGEAGAGNSNSDVFGYIHQSWRKNLIENNERECFYNLRELYIDDAEIVEIKEQKE